ncbi:hypothetical protein JOM56_007766 [Amanita muscaria]
MLGGRTCGQLHPTRHLAQMAILIAQWRSSSDACDVTASEVQTHIKSKISRFKTAVSRTRPRLQCFKTNDMQDPNAPEVVERLFQENQTACAKDLSRMFFKCCTTINVNQLQLVHITAAARLLYILERARSLLSTRKADTLCTNAGSESFQGRSSFLEARGNEQIKVSLENCIGSRQLSQTAISTGQQSFISIYTSHGTLYRNYQVYQHVVSIHPSSSAYRRNLVEELIGWIEGWNEGAIALRYSGGGGRHENTQRKWDFKRKAIEATGQIKLSQITGFINLYTSPTFTESPGYSKLSEDPAIRHQLVDRTDYRQFKQLNSTLNREVAEFERAATRGTHSFSEVGEVYEPSSELEVEAHVHVLGGGVSNYVGTQTSHLRSEDSEY